VPRKASDLLQLPPKVSLFGDLTEPQVTLAKKACYSKTESVSGSSLYLGISSSPLSYRLVLT